MSINSLDQFIEKDMQKISFTYSSMRSGEHISPMVPDALPKRAYNDMSHLPNSKENVDFFLINHRAGFSSFVHRRKIKSYECMSSHSSYIFEYDSDGLPIGKGQINFCIEVGGKSIVRVYDTFTDKAFRNQGFGLRRLYILNALSHAFYNLPLHSGHTFNHYSAKTRWEELVRRGHARCLDSFDRKFEFLRI